MTKAKNETPEQRERRRARDRAGGKKYRTTEKGKATVKRLSSANTASGKGAAATRRYAQTPQGAAKIAANRQRHTTRRREAGVSEREQSARATREQVRKEREARQMARRKIKKPPKREPYKGTKGYKTEASQAGGVHYGGLIPGVGRAEKWDWPKVPEGAEPPWNHFANWWSDIWEGVPVKKIMYGRKQIEAEDEYRNRLRVFRRGQRTFTKSGNRRRALRR